KGFGPEQADVIDENAAGKPCQQADEYTRRKRVFVGTLHSIPREAGQKPCNFQAGCQLSNPPGTLPPGIEFRHTFATKQVTKPRFVAVYYFFFFGGRYFIRLMNHIISAG